MTQTKPRLALLWVEAVLWLTWPGVTVQQASLAGCCLALKQQQAAHVQDAQHMCRALYRALNCNHHCCLQDEADYADISLLGRKLLAASATAAADRTTIEADAAKMTSTGPEYLPAHPGRNSRLRAKLYKRVCKEGEPCRKATRSYKIKVHHEK